jgi:hypothetical protein
VKEIKDMYEIDIRRKEWGEPVDMQVIYSALEQAGIEIDKDERRSSIYALSKNDEQPEYVYIADGRVGEAVKIINGLGYETDEDEDEE